MFSWPEVDKCKIWGSQAATCIEEADSDHHGIDHSEKELETLLLNLKSMFAWGNLKTIKNKRNK